MITVRCNGNRYNDFVSSPVEVSVGSSEIIEPVSVAEFKNYARLSGYEPDDAPELSFTSDDALIQQLITGARQSLEIWTGLSLVKHTWKVKVDIASSIELPYSNGGSIIESVDADGNDIDLVTENYGFLAVTGPQTRGNVITYSVDPECPAALKTAIMVEALFRYNNRGDMAAEGALSQKALSLSVMYKRASTWLA